MDAAQLEAQIIVTNLVAAKAKIATPAQWTKGDYTRDAAGHGTHTAFATATCYCTLGAAWSTRPDATSDAPLYLPESAFLRRAVDELTEFGENVADFNDHPKTTHEQVLAVFDRAIELAKEAAQ